MVESRWSWAWHPQLQAGHINEGYNSHHRIRLARPEFYDSETPPFHGWAVIRGKALEINVATSRARIKEKTLEIAAYPDAPAFDNWDEIAQLIASRIGLDGYTVARLPSSRP